MGQNDGHSVKSITTASSGRTTALRKRVQRACDECRLHKARCDGRQECGTCARHDRECSYDLLPTECKGSAGRIRVLERRLTRAKEHIRHLESEYPPKPVPVNLHKAIIPQQKPSSPAPFHVVVRPESAAAASIGFGLVEALLEPLSHHEDIKVLTSSDTTHDLLCDSSGLSNNGRPNTPCCRLPAYDTMLQIAFFAFNNVFGLPSIIPEHVFYAATQKLYNTDTDTPENIQFIPLFCGILALGLLYHSGVGTGFTDVPRESRCYFEVAVSVIDNVESYSSISELRVGLVVVTYLVNTSNLELARQLSQTIASSSIVSNLFQASAVQDSETPIKDIVWVVHYLDSHISCLLGIATQLSCSAIEAMTIQTINVAVRNVAAYKRSDISFLLSVSLAIAIELLRLIKCMVPDAIETLRPNVSYPENVYSSTNLQRWIFLEIELGTLESAFRRIFSDDDANPQISLARNELSMYFRTSRIMLHHKFLLYHSQTLSTNDPQHVRNINQGRTCVMAASTAISSISDRMETLQTTILTWLSAYTVFLSAVTLLVATIVLDTSDIYSQHTIEHTIRVAVQILKHATYGAGQNRFPYLNFLLAVSAKTNPQLESVLRSDISMPAPSHCSSRSEGSRESCAVLSPAFSHPEQVLSGNQRPSPTTTISPYNWGFD